MRVFLSGPMGAGKSTLARALAEALGCAAVDLDSRIEARVGMSIAALFQQRGEAAFRAIEREEAARLLEEQDVVVALGGGTVTDESTRRRLLHGGTLLTLMAPAHVLFARVRADGVAQRPLLDRDAAEALERLLGERRGAYAECHATLDATRPTGELVTEAAAIVREGRVPVPLGERSYAVEIGAGIRDRVHTRLEGSSGAVWVADENTARWRDPLAGNELRVTLDAGEANKHVDAVARIWDAALAARVDRGACVVAVGGGVVGDLAGFAAATLLRGVAFGQVPTSLLAMVDSSVGGKTGFNRDAGKNLVGAFHQPRFVLCDVDTLSTLPREERIAGLAEVAKAAWLDSETAVAALEADAEALVAGDPEATVRAIRRSVALKARVVEADEREAGLRMCLNLGHTLGHGLEAAAGYGELRHGEAVALGMVAAARVGVALGDLTTESARRLERLLVALALPTDLDRRLDDATFEFLRGDKKRTAAGVKFVVPGEPGSHRIQPLGFDELRTLVTA